MLQTIAWIVLSSVLYQTRGQHTTPIVNIQGLGSVQGSVGHTAWTNRTIYQFQAIPYAKPPTGELRFQPPRKKAAWSGTLDASKPGIHCPQLTGNGNKNENVDNEDCLTLSVYSGNLDAIRPVLVFIHGGWFHLGGASTSAPEYLLEANIVLVTIQYRLGPLGFLSTLSGKIPGNVGILDAIAALEWTQQYIRHFGGDATKVTIYGHSAGAAAVSAILHSPLVQNRPTRLFRSAILQSGSVFSPWALCETPVESALDIARRLGCNNPSTVEGCFLRAPVRNLLTAFNAHRSDTIMHRGYSYVGGTNIVVGGPSGLFPQHPRHYLRNSTKGIAVMGGSTSQEGLFLLNEICRLQPEKVKSLNDSLDLLAFIRLLHEKFGQVKLDGVLEGNTILEHFSMTQVDRARWDELVLGFVDICGNHGIKGPVLVDIHAFSNVNPANVFLYSFDYSKHQEKKNLSFPFPYEGAVDHSDDMKFLFPIEDLNQEETRLAKTMVQLWTSFVISGVPIAKSVPYWPPANRLYGPYLQIDEESKQKSYYLKEFSATSLRLKSLTVSGCGLSTASTVLLILLSVLGKLI